MTKKKKSLIILAIVIAVLLVAGAVVAAVFLLGGTQNAIANAENTYDPYYESFYDGKNDPGVKIDGKLEEDIWQNKGWYQNTYLSSPDANMPSWKITSHMSEYGLYLAAYIEDSNLLNDGQHTMEGNSNLEFYYFICNADEQESFNGLDRGYFVVDMRGDVHGTTGKFKRAVVVEGELNSGNSKSATIEMFFPWEFFKIDVERGIPENIYLYPIYCAVFEGKETITTSISSMDSVIKPQLYLYKDYWRFTKDGYKTPDREGAVVGDSVTGLAKTGNWDLSKEKDGIVRSANGSREHYMYFSDVFTSDFIVETTIVPVQQKAGDATAGLYFLTEDGQYHLVTLNTPNSVLVDSVNGTKNISKYLMSTYDSKKGAFNYHADCQGTNPNATSKEGVQLTVVKCEGKFWYFIDGKFMTSQQLDYMDADVIPALYAWAADVEFKNYSCKEANNEEIKQFLNEHGVYSVETKVKGTGGTVETSTLAITKGQKFDITVTCNSGYEVSSLLVNGKECLEDAKKNAKAGVYTLTAGDGNQEIEVTFKKCEGFKLKGVVKGQDIALSATLTLTSENNGLLRYIATANKDKGYQVVVPAGTYNITAEAEDYIKATVNVSVSGDTTKDITLKPSMFVSKVKVNGSTVSSKTQVWDRSQEELGKIYGSYSNGTSLAPLYFAKTGNAAWFSSTIRYSTDFVEGGSYQSDLLGGLWISDGARTGWFGIRQHGIVYNMTWIEKVIGYDVLSTWNKQHLTAKVDFVLLDGEFHIYVDGIYTTKLSVTKVLPGADKNAQLAFGLVMHAEKTADIEFSNISLNTDAKQVRDEFAKKQASDTIPEGTIFAQEVKLNGNTLQSKPWRWDLTKIKNGTVVCNDGVSTQPIWFAKTGNTALIQLTANRLDTEGTNRETQPLIGIMVSDGTKQGYFGVRASAIVTNEEWDHIIGRDILATWSGINTAKIEIALINDQFHVYIDDIFVKTVKVSDVIPGVKSGATLALGLTSEASGKTASVQFADVRYSTDAEKVNAYLDAKDPNKAIPKESIFAGTVTVNGKVVESIVPVWDLTDIANNTVIGKNGIQTQPLYFKETGKTALVRMKVSRLDTEGTNRESQPMAGIVLSDGTHTDYIGVRENSVVYGVNTWLKKSVSYDVFTTWGQAEHLTAEIDFIIKDNEIHIYVDGIFANKVKVSDAVSGIADDSTLAIGLVMNASGKSATMKFADIVYTTDATKVDKYLQEVNPDSAIPSDSIFAGSVTVNGNRVESIVPIWDITDIANGVVTGTNGSETQPLLFRQTGNAALVQTTITRLDDSTTTNRESQPMAGIYVTDGTNSGHIGVRANSIYYTNNGWKERVIAYDVFATWAPDHAKADVDIAFLENQFYVYVDDILVGTLKASDVVPGIKDDATVAVGLVMHASGKNAILKFSDVTYTTDATQVNVYINGDPSEKDILDGTLFAGVVRVNGTKLESALDKWDYSKADENIVTGTHTTTSAFCMDPIYFNKTGTSMLLQTTITNVSAEKSGQPMAGIYMTDGTYKGHFGLVNNGLVYGPYNTWIDTRLTYGVLDAWGGNQTVQFDVALKEGIFYIYVDGVYFTQLTYGTVLPNTQVSTELAFGLTLRTDSSTKPASMEFSNVQFTTDAAKVDAYMENQKYDPSIGAFINYAWALGQGYEKGVGSDKISVGENTTVFIGDSFFDRRWFWTDFYTDDFKDADAFCAGIGSTTTAHWTHLVDKVFVVCGNTAPKNIVIHLGTNDLGNDNATAEATANGLKNIFNILHTKYPDTKIYYFGITHRSDISVADKIDAVNSTISAWCEAQDYVTYINTPDKITSDMLRPDNLHPALETYAVFVNELNKAGCVVLDKDGEVFFEPIQEVVDLGIFTETVTINGIQLNSSHDKWDTSQIKNNKLTGTNLLDTQPIWFKATGNEALLKMTVTRKDDSSVTNRESQPLAGLGLTDGTNHGHLGVRAGGVIYNGNWINGKIGKDVLATWSSADNLSIELTIRLNDGKLLIYVDDVYATTLDVSQVVTGATADTQLAFSIVMSAFNKAATLEFSNIQFLTDEDDIYEALGATPISGTPFATAITANGVTLQSELGKWDYSLANNNTVRATSANGCILKPIYFSETGNTMLLQTTVSVASGTQGDPMAGIWMHDGSAYAYVGVRGAGLFTNAGWKNNGAWPTQELAPGWGGSSQINMDIVLKGGTIYVYVDGIYSTSITLSSIMPNKSANSALAYGLVAYTDGTRNLDMTFSNIRFTTDAAVVDAFLASKN